MKLYNVLSLHITAMNVLIRGNKLLRVLLKKESQIMVPADLSPILLNKTKKNNTFLIISNPSSSKGIKFHQKINKSLKSFSCNEIQFHLILTCNTDQEELYYCIKTIIEYQEKRKIEVYEMVADLFKTKDYSKWIQKYNLNPKHQFDQQVELIANNHIQFAKEHISYIPYILFRKNN
ncbi:hypothetical protein [Aquimarina sp. RZ0]|uniref:hypothetical protein n=1 Tax=Aquimarina sp. RZ0 TaxID=2607730 RepID=UPI0011F2F620|nr:hypothetical protein [Aquimarina sp. RZ0]KAA1243747.1 hypothetical protein F0000_19475 [Aquimarina sp. RZ0]